VDDLWLLTAMDPRAPENSMNAVWAARQPAALGVHPRIAMHILRHSQISVTMNVYTEIANPLARKALDQLNASLDGETP